MRYTEHTPGVACWRPTRASRGKACGGASLTTVSPTVLSLRAQVLPPPRGCRELRARGLQGAPVCTGTGGLRDLVCRSLCQVLFVRVAHTCDYS